MSATIWAYGPRAAFPGFDFGLPPDYQPPDHPKGLSRAQKRPLSDPTYSPMYGIDLLGELKRHGCDIHVSQYIGTEDLFYEQNLRLEKFLAGCSISHSMRIVRPEHAQAYSC